MKINSLSHLFTTVLLVTIFAVKSWAQADMMLDGVWQNGNVFLMLSSGRYSTFDGNRQTSAGYYIYFDKIIYLSSDAGESLAIPVESDGRKMILHVEGQRKLFSKIQDIYPKENHREASREYRSYTDELLDYSKALQKEYMKMDFMQDDVKDTGSSYYAGNEYTRWFEDLKKHLWDASPEEAARNMEVFQDQSRKDAVFNYQEDARNQSRKKAILETYKDQYQYYLDKPLK